MSSTQLDLLANEQPSRYSCIGCGRKLKVMTIGVTVPGTCWGERTLVKTWTIPQTCPRCKMSQRAIAMTQGGNNVA